MANLGRALMLVGGLIVSLGAVIYLVSKSRNLFGSLPGDIQIRQGNLTCIIPVVTSLIVSVVLTILLNVVIRYLNR